MLPLIVLLSVTGLACLVHLLVKRENALMNSARLGLSSMLIFTASGHFMFPEGMAMVIPGAIPFKSELVLITALMEILAAIGLQVPAYRKITGLLLILFFVVVLPANIHASIQEINYKTGGNDGHGIEYLLFRIPLQFLFIGWTYVVSRSREQE